MRTIICKNADGVEIRMSYEENAVFFIDTVDGVSSVDNSVATSSNTTVDGSTYQGSVTKQRNIVITLLLTAYSEAEHREYRNMLYKCFKPKTAGTLTFIEEDEKRIIDYRVESVDIDNTGVNRSATISLICPDPFFKDIADTEIIMAGWENAFEFIHEFKEEGEEFGYRTAEITKAIDNDSAADNIGMEITISATGPVTNPAVYHQEEKEHIKIGTDNQTFSMQAGDILRITTVTNEKDVVLIRDGAEESVNQYLDEESEFIQLVHGANTITYAADTGREYMNVSVKYRYRYLGV